jgi:hypothetical protein
MMRKSRIIYKITALVATLCVCAASLVLCPVYTEQPDEWTFYDIKKADDGYQLFSNHIDGYEILLPADMTIDMSCANICAMAFGSDTRIEIYRQDLAGGSAEGYIAYSNKFAADSEITVKADEFADSEEKVHLFIWSRKKLSRLENDMNYYASIDIADEKSDAVFSILVKSADIIDSYSDVDYLVKSFKPAYRVSEEAASVKTQLTDFSERGWNLETQEFYREYLSDVTKGLAWGIFEPDTANFDYSTLRRYEEYLDYSFPVILHYTQAETSPHSNLAERLTMAWNEGKVLELTFQMTPLDAGNMMYEVLDGEYDEFLENYAAVIADFGHPVLFRPLNEMNGDWCIYSAYHTCKDTEVYKAVYRYIYEIFRGQGALENTIWVWNPNSKSYPDFKWNDAFMYYPGDEYVDVVGLTAYNTGTFYSEYGEAWTEFSELYDELYEDYSERFSQPLIITEFACAEFGGDKELWMEEMFKVIAGYDRIRLAIWWDGCDWDAYGNVARSYFLDSSEETLATFKAGLHGEITGAPTKGFSSAYSAEEQQRLAKELAASKLAALRAGTTIEENRHEGRTDTRPSWLEHRRDGSWGYSEEMLEAFNSDKEKRE